MEAAWKEIYDANGGRLPESVQKVMARDYTELAGEEKAMAEIPDNAKREALEAAMAAKDAARGQPLREATGDAPKPAEGYLGRDASRWYAKDAPTPTTPQTPEKS